MNTSQGVLTDMAGKFSISASADQVLRFSFVGLTTQEIAVGDKTTINVMMSEDATQLDDVVVVGYGTQRVRDLTGAATSVSIAQIPDLPGTSLVDALAGQVVGLSVSQSDGRPGSTGSFQIRQPVQLGDARDSYKQPLIVIDGVVQLDYKGEPTMDTFNMLDRSEIENMTVLKDASAAVYGNRASAGVILVETKRGTSGQAKINYSGRIDLADAVSHAKYMNAYELGVFTNRMIDQHYNNKNKNGLTPSEDKYTDEELQRMKSLNYDWLDHAWSSSFSHRHSLTVDGGSDKATFFAGVSYQDQGNNLGRIQDYSKWTFRAGGNIQVAAGLKLSATVSGYNSERVKIRSIASSVGDYTRLRNMPEYIPWEWEIDGENHWVSPWIGPIEVNRQVDSNVSTGYAVQNYFANDASKARDTNEDNGWSSNFTLKYDVPFVKGLSLSGSYSISHSNYRSTQVGDYYQVARSNETAVPGKHLLGDWSTDWTILNYGDPNGTDIQKKPGVDYEKTIVKSEQMNFQVNYSRMFGKHDVSATGVIERAETYGTRMKQRYNGVGVSYNGSSETAGTLDAGKSSFFPYESGALSYIGRVNYKYADRYLFQFVIRADASTKFAPENYWGTFPTGSVGWVISEENFFKGSRLSNIFQFLKVRYSLGKTGKDNLDTWTWLTNYKISSTSGLGFGEYGGRPVNGSTLAGTANRDIKWDETIKQNVGLDLNVLSSRLSVSTDFYYDKTSDLIFQRFYEEEPIYIGAPVPMVNYGKMDAWGWEFSARWSDKIEQSWLPSWGPIRYGIGVDYSISWNKVVLGNEPVFDYPATVDEASKATGWRSPGHEWGFKTWKHTSTGDGILRTQDDIENYWAYLTTNAKASDTTPSYFGKTKEDIFPGMLAYEDYAGSKNADNSTIDGPDGRIHASTDRAQDYQKLASKRRHGINTRLNLQWGNFSWSTQLSTSWGGLTTIDADKVPGLGSSDFINSQLIYVTDMFDPVSNPNGKYPSMAVADAYGTPSDFWKVSSFRMYVRNMTFGYNLPKQWLDKIKVDKVQISVTGNNLWDFYNPYPKKFRNMYDNISSGYPTLRTWTFALNVTF